MVSETGEIKVNFHEVVIIRFGKVRRLVVHEEHR